MAVNTVDLVISRHEAADPGLHAGLHRGQVNFPQLPSTNPGSGGIDTAGGLTLTAHMLGGDIHAHALDGLHHGAAHAAGEIRVFAEALLAAAPTGIPQHIQAGYQGKVDAHFLQLLSCHLGSFAQQFRIKGSTCRQVHRQQIAVQGLVAVGAFGAKQGGDAQAGMLDDVFLDLVGGLGGQHTVQTGFKGLGRPGVCPVQAVQGAQAGIVFHLVLEFVGEDDVLPFPDEAGKAVEPLGQLAHLLPESHPGKQVGHALLYAKIGILIRVHRIPPFIS